MILSYSFAFDHQFFIYLMIWYIMVECSFLFISKTFIYCISII